MLTIPDNKDLSELIDFLNQQQASMIDQLHRFCNINSGTYHLNGLRKMHFALKEAFSPLADETETITVEPVREISMQAQENFQTFGECLFFSKRPELKKRILLMGHMDTVYPEDSPFQTCRYINENHLQGPGVTDMKGGLIVILHALSAFEHSPLAAHLGWDLFINADEEVGSPSSRAFMESIASHYQAGLIYEPALDSKGTFAKNRKGLLKVSIVAKGLSAHAGRAFHEGRNAIAYLAEAILSIHALNGKREGLTINIGKIAGGTASNVVPDTAVLRCDIRLSNAEDEPWVMQELQQIVNGLSRKAYSLSLSSRYDRPVRQVHNSLKNLFQRLQKVAQRLSLSIDWQDSGGCCDGNNLSYFGLPVIDTMGVRGGLIHSSEEFILLDSLVERAALSAAFLIDLAKENA